MFSRPKADQHPCALEPRVLGDGWGPLQKKAGEFPETPSPNRLSLTRQLSG